MVENKKVPEIRFKGFTEDWEQRKLGEVGDFRSNGVDKKVNLDEIEVNLLNYMDVYNFRKINNNNVNTLMKVTAKSNQITECNIQKNDIFFTPTSETADDIGHVLVIEEKLENTVYSYHLMRYRPQIGEFYSTFPNYGFATRKLRAQMKIFAKGVQRFVISKPDFEQLEIKRPCIEEQKKIAFFMTQLDNLITLHQRKYEKLVNVKKSMLEKLFPKNSSKVPEIRFKGFTEDWEQRKVHDIYKITRGYVLAAPETDATASDEMPYPVYSSQTKNDGLMGYYKDYLYENAITWTTDGANAGTVNYRAGKFYCTNVCGVLLSEEGYSNKCAAEALNSIAWKWVSHVGNPKLMNNVMGEIPIVLPKSVEEQNHISEFFIQMDNLITLHQRKLEKLNNIKKSMLDKMFV